MTLHSLKQWLIDRSKERSSWIGVVSILTALGMAITPEQTDAIAAAGIAIGGLIATLTKDKA